MEQELGELGSRDLETVGLSANSSMLSMPLEGGGPAAWPLSLGQNLVAKNLHRPGVNLGFGNGEEELLVRQDSTPGQG